MRGDGGLAFDQAIHLSGRKIDGLLEAGQALFNLGGTRKGGPQLAELAMGPPPADSEPDGADETDLRRSEEEAGAGKPAGRLYHSCFGPKHKVQVFDAWESQAAFDTFGRTLRRILKEIGVDPGQPQIAPIHNIIAR